MREHGVTKGDAHRFHENLKLIRCIEEIQDLTSTRNKTRSMACYFPWTAIGSLFLSTPTTPTLCTQYAGSSMAMHDVRPRTNQ